MESGQYEHKDELGGAYTERDSSEDDAQMVLVTDT